MASAQGGGGASRGPVATTTEAAPGGSSAADAWKAPPKEVPRPGQANQYSRAYEFLKKHPYKISEALAPSRILKHSGLSGVPVTALVAYAAFVSYQLRDKTNRHIEERNQLQGRVENLEAELQVAQTKQFMAVKKECARCCKDLVADVKDQLQRKWGTQEGLAPLLPQIDSIVRSSSAMVQARMMSQYKMQSMPRPGAAGDAVV